MPELGTTTLGRTYLGQTLTVISDDTVAQIEKELRNRIGGGAGLLEVMRVDETHRVDADGYPRALPVGLDPEAN